MVILGKYFFTCGYVYIDIDISTFFQRIPVPWSMMFDNISKVQKETGELNMCH